MHPSIAPTADLPAPDSQYDLIVVGSGAAALSAAVTAAVFGLKTAVIEKAAVLGGTTAISAGGVWIPCNHLASGAGVHDTPEAAWEYLRHCAGACFRPDLVAAFITHAPRMLRFMEDRAAVRFSYAAGRPDYRPDIPGAAHEGRTIHPLPFDGRRLGTQVSRLRPPLREMTFLGLMIKPGPDLKHFLNALRSFESFRFVARKLARHFRDLIVHHRPMDLSNGNGLVARLILSALENRADIFTSCGLESLEVRDGRVVAVQVTTADGPRRMIASRGVVLATGGFSHDRQRQQQLFPHAARGQAHHSPVPATLTGDALRAAEAVGARLNLHQRHAACWAPVSRIPKGDGTHVNFPHLIDRQKPGFIAVNRSGQRFVNEASSYHDFGQAMIAACENEEEVTAYLIADHRAMRRYGMGAARPHPLPFGEHIRSGYLIRAHSIGELARTLNLPVSEFVETVKIFNEHARAGHDPAFGKGSNLYNQYNGDASHRPNPCLAPIENAPFYAVRLHIGELGTLLGLDIDHRARVLDHTGRPIAGLYAAGNDASNLMGGDYPGGGATLGPGMAMGYLAALHAARQIDEATDPPILG
jgi:succinate dehydrogenase/fumarate reductase flavoprotein subunit